MTRVATSALLRLLVVVLLSVPMAIAIADGLRRNMAQAVRSYERSTTPSEFAAIHARSRSSAPRKIP